MKLKQEDPIREEFLLSLSVTCLTSDTDNCSQETQQQSPDGVKQILLAFKVSF